MHGAAIHPNATPSALNEFIVPFMAGASKGFGTGAGAEAQAAGILALFLSNVQVDGALNGCFQRGFDGPRMLAIRHAGSRMSLWCRAHHIVDGAQMAQYFETAVIYALEHWQQRDAVTVEAEVTAMMAAAAAAAIDAPTTTAAAAPKSAAASSKVVSSVSSPALVATSHHSQPKPAAVAAAALGASSVTSDNLASKAPSAFNTPPTPPTTLFPPPPFQSGPSARVVHKTMAPAPVLASLSSFITAPRRAQTISSASVRVAAPPAPATLTNNEDAFADASWIQVACGPAHPSRDADCRAPPNSAGVPASGKQPAECESFVQRHLREGLTAVSPPSSASGATTGTVPVTIGSASRIHGLSTTLRPWAPDENEFRFGGHGVDMIDEVDPENAEWWRRRYEPSTSTVDQGLSVDSDSDREQLPIIDASAMRGRRGSARRVAASAGLQAERRIGNNDGGSRDDRDDRDEDESEDEDSDSVDGTSGSESTTSAASEGPVRAAKKPQIGGSHHAKVGQVVAQAGGIRGAVMVANGKMARGPLVGGPRGGSGAAAGSSPVRLPASYHHAGHSRLSRQDDDEE